MDYGPTLASISQSTRLKATYSPVWMEEMTHIPKNGEHGSGAIAANTATTTAPPAQELPANRISRGDSPSGIGKTNGVHAAHAPANGTAELKAATLRGPA